MARVGSLRSAAENRGVKWHLCPSRQASGAFWRGVAVAAGQPAREGSAAQAVSSARRSRPSPREAARDVRAPGRGRGRGRWTLHSDG